MRDGRRGGIEAHVSESQGQGINVVGAEQYGVLDVLPFGCALVGSAPEARIEWCTEPLAALLGVEHASLVGASLPALLGSMGVVDPERLREVLESGVPMMVDVLTPGGDERCLEIASAGEGVGGRCVIIVSDVTARRDSATETVLLSDRCRAITDGARDIVLLVTEAGDITFANNAAADAYGRPVEELVGMNVRDIRAEETRSYVAEQMHAAQELGVLFETWHVRADGTAFPVEVSSRGVVIGGERALLSIVRDISARRDREIERERLMVELELANGRLNALLRIVARALDSVELDEMLAGVTSAVREVTGADASLLVMVEPAGLRVMAEDGADGFAPRGMLFAPEETFAGRVVEVADAVYIADVQESDFATDVHRRGNVVTMVGVPLILDGAVIGVVECAWRAHRVVSDSELVMLSVAADRLVGAIAGAQRYELTRRAERLNASAAEVASMVGASLEESASLTDALELAARVIDCDAGGYGSFVGNVWEFRRGFGLPEGTRVAVPFHGPSNADPRQTAPVVVLEAGSERSGWLGDELGLAEAMVVPVAVNGEWTGALVFGRRESGSGFDELVQGFARRVSQAVSLAYGNMREFESEHRIAETLQESLLRLPERLPGVTHASLYNSSTVATRVGGDFYDLFALPDGRVGAVVGDVSGKGLDAAVLTSVIKDTIRAYAHECPAPSEVMAKANHVLCTSARLPDFASVVYLTLDPETGEFAYCCAGHPPIIAIRADGGAEACDCGSPVIGAFTEIEFVESTGVLGEGDSLVLYTDGITEARAGDGEFFGDSRLLETLSDLSGSDVSQVAQALFERVAGFADGRLADDIAVLTLSLDRSGDDA